MTARENVTAWSDTIPQRLACSQVFHTHSYWLSSQKRHHVILGEHVAHVASRQMRHEGRLIQQGRRKYSKHICTGCTTSLCVVSKVKQLQKKPQKKTLESWATGIHTRVSLRDKMWASIFPMRCALETGPTPFPTTQQPKHPNPTHMLPSSPLPPFIQANKSKADSTAEWNIHGRDEAEAAERLCTFLHAVCTGGTLWAGEVFRAGCLRWWCAAEEEEKSVD